VSNKSGREGSDSSRVPLLDLRALDAPKLSADAAWWAIYRASFPDTEREPERVLIDAVATGRSMAIEARQDDAIVGIAATTLLREPPAVFLSYIAAAPGVQGHGVGGALLGYAWSAGARVLAESGHGGACLVCEVEKPALADGSEELARRVRRVRFFCRHGGIVLPRAYYQPPLAGTAALPLHLIYFDRAQREPEAERQDELVRAIYRERYEKINKVDRKVLDALRQQTS
jgi:hypothetical protein